MNILNFPQIEQYLVYLARESAEHDNSIRTSERNGGITSGDNFLEREELSQ
jgi:hypothetical protein